MGGQNRADNAGERLQKQNAVDTRPRLQGLTNQRSCRASIHNK